MPVVGNTSTDYANVRNINSLPFRRYTFHRVLDLCALGNAAWFRVRGKAHPFLLNFHRSLGSPGADILHFFNKVSAGTTPWLSTFETALPRWNTSSEAGLRRMAGQYCFRLIGLSNASLHIQSLMLEPFPVFREEILPKLMVLHPGQLPKIGDYTEKRVPSDWLECTLVGNQIFSKGGREAVAAVQQLNAEGFSIRLNIVSGMEPDSYASFTTEQDVQAFQRTVAQAGTCVRLLGRLRNQQVLELLKTSHLALLPTYADTYGYSVLEAQACGCPVITTNIRALPEINPEQAGWQIQIPKNELNNAILTTPEDRDRLFGSIHEGIYTALRQALENPGMVREKGMRSLERIRRDHRPEDRAEILEDLYDQALGIITK